ncbi:hypothetical protein DMB65_00450 [Flavobacterium cheongpyeongense]|uniref:Uncharacterized protein n=1 Tax=Flavobacterium cheongpyeongense TaxID=2212651 RepID=A0A2V4BV86_9FLAO|nr:hypothetical protein [Flavobacterium cheongpyeongense]PXY42532.1 hypothetical protein DMB65_00450 [Flavobacterium cheongpyeongense]
MDNLKVENPQNYWGDFEQSSSWNFTLDKKFLLENKDSFLEKFISIGVKYGVIIPSINTNQSLLDGINLLKNKILAKTDIDYRTLFYDPFVNVLTNRVSIKSDMYINSNQDISIARFESNSNSYNFFDIQIIDKFRLLLYTDAFFSVLYNRRTDFNSFNNKELSYLNATRFNSYLRELLILMKNYKSVFDFENGFEIIEEGDKSLYFRDMYLLVDNEVLFYENIYELLPEKHRYKTFEEIQIKLDDAN